jgi:hypothetical protein
MDFYIFAEIPLPSLFLHWHAYFQLSTNYIIQNLAMDELYWDIFRAAHETWDDKLFSEAQELFPQCPCRRSDASNPRCVRCKLLSVFARRQPSNDLPRERKSTLEIVSSPANHTSPEWSEHRTDVATTSPRQALDEEHEGLPFEWDEEREHGIYDFDYSRAEEFDDTLDIEPYTITSVEPEMAGDETLDMAATGNTELVHAFISPALRLVLGNFVPHRQGWLHGPNTSLWGAARIIFEQSHRKGTAHAVGVWANSDNPSI